MAKKKRSPPQSLTVISSSEHPSAEALDFDAVIALLQSQYPLIDPPLIIALISDHESSTLSLHLEEIRDQLGIIQATLVPDTDIPGDYPYEAEPSLIDELESKLSNLDVDAKRERAIGGSSSRTNGLSHSTQSDKLSVPFGPSGSTELSRSTSTGSSRKSSNANPTADLPSHGEDVESGFEDEVEYLRGLFPMTSVSIIRHALIAETSFSSAIDHLLSLELIKEYENGGSDVEPEAESSKLAHDLADHHALPPALTQPHVEEIRRGRLPASPKNKKKAKNKTVPLVDTLQRRPTPSSSTHGSARSSRTSSPNRSPGIAMSGPSSNAWGTVASLSMYLAELVPDRPQSYFLSYLHSPAHHSAYSAVRASLQALPPVSRDDKDGQIGYAILQDMYGLNLLEGEGEGEADEKTRRDLEICTRVIDDLAGVMDLMDLLAEISEWPGDDDLERYDMRMFPTAPVPSSPLVQSAATLRLPEEKHSSEAVPVRAVPNPDRLLTRPAPTKPVSAHAAGPSEPFAQGKGAIREAVERIVPGSKTPLSGYASPTAFDGIGTFPTSPSAPKRSANPSGKQIHPLNWRTVDHTRHRPSRRDGLMHRYASHIPSYANGATPHDPTPGSLFSASTASGSAGPTTTLSTAQQITIDQCLNRAQAERLKRQEAIRAVGRHFARAGGNLPGGKAVNASVAGHYASQAREAANNARQWELRAARMIVGNQLDASHQASPSAPASGTPVYSPAPSVDLHHLTVEEATTVILEVADKWYKREKQRAFDGASQTKGLTVVTGVGRHSAGRKGVLGPAVANALEGAGWRVERGESGRGYLVVKGRR